MQSQESFYILCMYILYWPKLKSFTNFSKLLVYKSPQKCDITMFAYFTCRLHLQTEFLPCPSSYAMAPHSSIPAWKIPWMEEPGGLQSMGLQRVRQDWVTSLSLFTFMHWRRKWQPTPVFLPGESQGRGSLAGCRLWGCTELDTTEAT